MTLKAPIALRGGTIVYGQRRQYGEGLGTGQLKVTGGTLRCGSILPSHAVINLGNQLVLSVDGTYTNLTTPTINNGTDEFNFTSNSLIDVAGAYTLQVNGDPVGRRPART